MMNKNLYEYRIRNRRGEREKDRKVHKCQKWQKGINETCRGDIFEVGTKSYEGKPCLLILSFAFFCRK